MLLVKFHDHVWPKMAMQNKKRRTHTQNDKQTDKHMAFVNRKANKTIFHDNNPLELPINTIFG